MNVLLNSRPCQILLAVAKQTGSQGINTLGKTIYATYKSRYETLVTLEAVGFVRFEKLGREVIVWLTPSGERAMKHVTGLMSLG